MVRIRTESNTLDSDVESPLVVRPVGIIAW